MNKKSFSLIISILIILVTFPVFANQTIIPDNLVGAEIEEINYPEKMVNNYGTVKKVNDSGYIDNNYGTVIDSRGSIYNNYGKIDSITDQGSVYINEGVINKNNYRVELNNSNGVIKENNYRVITNQYGTVEINNAQIWYNFGNVGSNTSNGVIDENFGTVTSNSGTILKNSFVTSGTLINSVTNTENGKVKVNEANVNGGIVEQNNGKVELATIEKNYSKEVTRSTINNNYSDEVGDNNLIKNNFAKRILNAAVQNQYYKLTIKGNANFEAAIDLDGDLTNNIFVDSEGQTWIREEDAMYTIKAKRGYRIIGAEITAGGETKINWEDPRNVGITNVSGEVTVEIETEEIETYKVVFDANGGKFSSNGSEILTYEKWLPDDYENLENPARDGYTFVGYFTQKDGGTNFANYYAEAGVDQDMTLYAHWKDNSNVGGASQEQGSSAQPSAGAAGTPAPEPQLGTAIESPKTNNPQTGNSIIIWFAILIVSVVGLIITRKKQ